MRRVKRGFTLIELLVVISIIIFAMAIAAPAVTKFTRGRSLDNAGRLMQTVINEGRRAAITTRKPHFLIMFQAQSAGIGQPQIGFRVFQQGKADGDGYTSGKWLMPRSLTVQMTQVPVPGLVGIVQEPPAAQAGVGLVPGDIRSGCRLAVFNDCPALPSSVSGEATVDGQGGIWQGVDPQSQSVIDLSSAYTSFFDFPAMRPVTSDNRYGWLQFRRDGTVDMTVGGLRDVPAQEITDDSLYDRNITFPEAKLNEGEILADFTLRQQGEPKKRCYVDVDPNTGRARFRVCLLNGYSGRAGTVGN